MDPIVLVSMATGTSQILLCYENMVFFAQFQIKISILYVYLELIK